MGNKFMSSRKKPLVVAECSIPAYSVKTIGSRHFLVAGGGGGVKTGVRNEIEIFLLTYNQLNKSSDGATSLKAKQTGTIDTTEFANMNMDVILLEPPQNGRYLVAVGHDQNCALFESVGFCMSEGGDETSSARLSLQFCSVCRWPTDFNPKEPYQKCVKLFRFGASIHLATGGSDGHVRVWDASALLDRYSKTRHEYFCALDVDSAQREVSDVNDVTSLLDIDASAESGRLAGEINDLDVALSGDVFATIVGKVATLWSTTDGKKLIALPSIPQLAGTDIRSLKFLNLDKSGRNEIFACAFNKRLGRSKTASFLALFAYEKKASKCHLIAVDKACDEAISTLIASDSGDFLAIGTMDGSVGVFDTHSLSKSVYFARACHSSFVTSVEFLPQRTYDTCEWGRISPTDSMTGDISKCNDNNNKPAGHVFLPGVCSGEARASVLSLSVDNSIQVHQVRYLPKSTFTGFLLRLMVSLCLLYLILWFLFLY